MGQRLYFGICAFIFLAMALGHLSRLLSGWELVVAGWVVPKSLSIVGLIVTGLLSAWGFSLSSRARPRRKYHM
jgi:hypothetical protein